MHKIYATVMFAGFSMLSACGDDEGMADDQASETETTLVQVWERGVLRCGINGDQRGFSDADAEGVMRGLDADYCRAVAAGIGVTDIEFIALTAQERLDAVRDGRVDVLSRTTTWTLNRDSEGLDFVGTIFYDGEGFLVKARDGVTTIADFVEPRFCILTGTTSRANIESYFPQQDMPIMEYATETEMRDAFLADECNAYTYDRSALVGVRLDLPTPEEFVILDDVTSKEPLSPVVKDSDPQWSDIAQWTLFALINAEELGITAANVESLQTSDNLDIQRFLGVGDQNLAEALGLSPDWAAQVIREVGNYEEIFARNLGADSELNMPRGLNSLWLDGGLLYAPPIK